jgi:hypothetical protein
METIEQGTPPESRDLRPQRVYSSFVIDIVFRHFYNLNP